MCLLFCFVLFWIFCCVVCEKIKIKIVDNKKKKILGLFLKLRLFIWRLRSELQVLYSDEDLQGNRGKLCDYLVFLKDMELDSAMPQLYKLFSLVATIGATSAGVERSFSCLKRLKSYTRNTMGQGRLSSLALLAIERTLVKSLEKMPSWYDRVTEHFLEKERRAEFMYK